MPLFVKMSKKTGMFRWSHRTITIGEKEIWKKLNDLAIDFEDKNSNYKITLTSAPLPDSRTHMNIPFNMQRQKWGEIYKALFGGDDLGEILDGKRKKKKNKMERDTL